jgi:adenosyl cobinamide kinase/adenosyl cobinamide phosphate guanylyltransferase
VITLVLGGARSGKSRVAERLAGMAPQPVSYVATWVPDPADLDMAARIAVHRARRPPAWRTVECGPDLIEALQRTPGTALVESLGTWVTGVYDFAVDAAALCKVLRSRDGDAVVVSEEVGLGVHPETALGRRFRDVLGEVNQSIAGAADEAVLVVAGRVLPLDRLG